MGRLAGRFMCIYHIICLINFPPPYIQKMLHIRLPNSLKQYRIIFLLKKQFYFREKKENITRVGLDTS